MPGHAEFVSWYRYGKRSSKPQLALVVGQRHDRLVLHIFQTADLQPVIVEKHDDVRHIDAEQEDKHRSLNGCWDYPGAPCPL